MARAALALTGLQDAWDNAADMIFSDPDCGDLLDTIGLEYNSAQATTTLITNSNGVYTSTG
jgi:hypothetical protein